MTHSRDRRTRAIHEIRLRYLPHIFVLAFVPRKRRWIAECELRLEGQEMSIASCMANGTNRAKIGALIKKRLRDTGGSPHVVRRLSYGHKNKVSQRGEGINCGYRSSCPNANSPL